MRPTPVIVLVLILACAKLLEAQAPSGAGRGGGSGRATASTNGQRLDFTMAVPVAFDSEPSPEFRALVPRAGRVKGGYSSMLMGAAEYGWTRRRLGFSATGSGSARYYPSLDRVLPTASTISLSATWRVASRATLDLRQTASYSPSYLFRVFPNVVSSTLEESVAAAPDYRIDDRKSYAYMSRIGFQGSTRRGHTFSVAGERSRTDFTNPGRLRPNREFMSGAANWTQRIGRNGTLAGGYEFREGMLGFGGRATEQRLRVGLGHSLALSGTRRLGVRFNMAPSRLERSGAGTAPAAADDPDATESSGPGEDTAVENPSAAAGLVRYRLETDATATYPLLRSWIIAAAYQRRMQYIPILQDPVFSNAGQLQVQGFVTRRLDVAVSAGYAESQSAFRRSGRRFDTYQARASVRLALAPSVSVYGEYLNYYYDLRSVPDLAPDLPGRFQQHGVRVGVTVWGRLIGR